LLFATVFCRGSFPEAVIFSPFRHEVKQKNPHRKGFTGKWQHVASVWQWFASAGRTNLLFEQVF
jgi:hypothetical protein